MASITPELKKASGKIVGFASLFLLTRFVSIEGYKFEQSGFTIDLSKSDITIHTILFVVMLYYAYRYFLEAFSTNTEIRRSFPFVIDYGLVLVVFGLAILVAVAEYSQTLWHFLFSAPPKLFWKVTVFGISWGAVTALIKVPFTVRPYDPRGAPIFVGSLIVFIVVLAISFHSLLRAQLGLGWFLLVYVAAGVGKIYALYKETIFRHNRWAAGRR